MAEKQGTLLTNINGFPPAIAQQLAELWITTAEELVSASTPASGVQSLADYLGMSLNEALDIVILAQDSMPFGLSFSPADVPQYGRGALPDTPEELPAGSPMSTGMQEPPLPVRVDLRDRMPPIRNQGVRPTCVAFATVALREFLFGYPANTPDLSEQFVYWACKESDNFPLGGTYLKVGMQCVTDKGACLESTWPYNGDFILLDNEGQGPPSTDAQKEATAYRFTSFAPLDTSSPLQVRQALANDRPIAFSTVAFDYWYTDPVRLSGDIRLPLSSDTNPGGHAMCIVGYEDDPTVPGGGFYLVRNSWGADWAESSRSGPGYCRLPYDYLRQYPRGAFIANNGSPPS